MVVSLNSFLSKVLDDPIDWITRPYSALEGRLPILFTSLESISISRYRDSPWSEEELSFVACAFPSHKISMKLKLIIPIGLPTNLVLTKAYWDISLL